MHPPAGRRILPWPGRRRRDRALGPGRTAAACASPARSARGTAHGERAARPFAELCPGVQVELSSTNARSTQEPGREWSPCDHGADPRQPLVALPLPAGSGWWWQAPPAGAGGSPPSPCELGGAPTCCRATANWDSGTFARGGGGAHPGAGASGPTTTAPCKRNWPRQTVGFTRGPLGCWWRPVGPRGWWPC